jgi:hypothetical protein
MSSTHEALVRSYLDAINRRDFGGIGAIFADTADQEWPGSAELIHGRDAIVAVAQATPTLPRTRLLRLRSGADLTIAEWAADYGDGKTWQVASLFEFSEDKVIRKTDYFVAGAQPPEWRRGMTDVLRWPAS